MLKDEWQVTEVGMVEAGPVESPLYGLGTIGNMGFLGIFGGGPKGETAFLGEGGGLADVGGWNDM